jgi:TetR/AcrR family transcriptional repressor of nem operon
MARPREFDESAVLDAAVQCFWRHGYEATSIRDLADQMSITGASIYNAFGDKRSLFRRALEHYVEQSVADRIRRLEPLEPRQAIAGFFEEIISRSVNDKQRKGCMLVNSALEVAPNDPEFRRVVAEVFARLEAFFRRCIETGQHAGTISASQPAEDLSRLLLGVLLGIRVLARTRPDRAVLESIVRPALSLLDVPSAKKACRR